MNRRTFLAAPVGLAAVPALAIPNEPEDPIMPLYREWFAAKSKWRSLVNNWPGDDETPEMKALDDRSEAAFWQLIDMTPRSKEGIAALTHVLFDEFGCPGISDANLLSGELLRPQNRLILSIWRAASGQGGYPRLFA